MRRVFILPIFLALVGAGCADRWDRLISVNYYLTPELHEQSRAEVEQTLVKLAEQIGISTKIFEERKRSLDIRMGYPELQAGGSTSSRETFNKAMKAYIDGTVDQFKKDFEAAGSASDAGDWLLSSDYRVPYTSPSLVSVVIDGSMYQGGAHPNSFYQTFIYLVQKERFVSAEEVFSEASDLLAASDAAQKELAARNISDAEWIQNGAGPSMENYRHVYVTEAGLAVIFPPYQVAAYAAGPQEVIIPWNSIPGARNTLGLGR